MGTLYPQVLTLTYQNELNNSWLNCTLRCHGGGETCASLTGDWRWRVHTGSDSNYNSPYLYEVHTFLFYCRLGSSCKRAVLLKSVTWTCTIWLFSIKWTIARKHILLYSWTATLTALYDLCCGRKEVGPKPEHKQDGRRCWEVRQSRSTVSFYWYC